jgi:hypothetical protein
MRLVISLNVVSSLFVIVGIVGLLLRAIWTSNRPRRCRPCSYAGPPRHSFAAGATPPTVRAPRSRR